MGREFGDGSLSLEDIIGEDAPLFDPKTGKLGTTEQSKEESTAPREEETPIQEEETES